MVVRSLGWQLGPVEGQAGNTVQSGTGVLLCGCRCLDLLPGVTNERDHSGWRAYGHLLEKKVQDNVLINIYITLHSNFTISMWPSPSWLLALVASLSIQHGRGATWDWARYKRFWISGPCNQSNQVYFRTSVPSRPICRIPSCPPLSGGPATWLALSLLRVINVGWWRKTNSSSRCNLQRLFYCCSFLP